MARIETWYKQDLTQPVSVHYLDGNVFSQDNQGNLLGAHIFNNGAPASLSGSVSASIIRADGKTVAASGVLSNNDVYVLLPESAYYVPGLISVVIKLTTGGVVTTLCAIVANVYQSTTDTIVDPGTILPSIASLISEIDSAIASIPADYSSLWGSIAPVFNSSRQGGYKSGEYCTYNGHFYRFKVDHSGSWSASDVDAVNVGDELVALLSRIATAFNPDRSGGYKAGEYCTYNGHFYRFKVDHSGSWSASDVVAVNIGEELVTLLSRIAPVFNPNKSGGYKVGEYCTYNGHFYRFKVDHSGSWSASDVVAVNVGDEIVSLLSKIATVFNPDRSGGYKAGEYCTYNNVLYWFKTDHSGAWSSSDVVAVNIGDELVKTDKIIRQGQTCAVTLESGSYYDSNGAIKHDGVPSRIRNVYPVSISEISSIIIPYNYEMWVIRLDENGYYISNAGAWKTGKQNIKDIITEKTKFINFAIRKITAPDADISSEIATVESKLTYDRNVSVAYETDVTVNYPLTIGQAYGAVGSAIIFSDGLAYHHTKILKSDKIKKVTFSTTYTSPDVSSYIQYVDNNDIIIALDVVKNTYALGHVYDYYPVFPAGATGMYVTCGFIDSTSRDWKLQIYKETNIDGDGLQSEIDSKKDKYDDIIKSVNRIANGVGNFPRQSIVGYKQAYKLGFRAMLCDLRWTSDNVPVLEHDEILNGYYHDVYTENGELVSTDPPIYIAQTTYNDLLAYDFGYYKGAQFKGTKIMTFEQMLNLCKLLGCEVYIETKTNLTTEQYAIAFSLIRQYGMERQCVWNPQSLVELAELVAYEPNVYINLHTNISAGNALGDDKVNAVINAVNDYNRGHVSLTLFLGATMTETQAKALSAAGVGVMGTTLNTSAQVLEYYNQGKPYTCITSALSDGIIVGKVLFENIM